MSDAEQIEKAVRRLRGIERYGSGDTSFLNVEFWEVEDGKLWVVLKTGLRRLSMITPEQFQNAVLTGRIKQQ